MCTTGNIIVQEFGTWTLDSGLTIKFNTSLGKVCVLSGSIQIFESLRHFPVCNAVRSWKGFSIVS